TYFDLAADAFIDRFARIPLVACELWMPLMAHENVQRRRQPYARFFQHELEHIVFIPIELKLFLETLNLQCGRAWERLTEWANPTLTRALVRVYIPFSKRTVAIQRLDTSTHGQRRRRCRDRLRQLLDTVCRFMPTFGILNDNNILRRRQKPMIQQRRWVHPTFHLGFACGILNLIARAESAETVFRRSVFHNDNL